MIRLQSSPVHHETKVLPIYALVIAQNGPKFQEAKSGDTYPNGFKGPGGRCGAGAMLMGLGGGQVNGVTAQGVPLADLVKQLTEQLGRPVLDKTGLSKNGAKFNGEKINPQDLAGTRGNA